MRRSDQVLAFVAFDPGEARPRVMAFLKKFGRRLVWCSAGVVQSDGLSSSDFFVTYVTMTIFV
jgi:hypothetical protein